MTADRSMQLRGEEFEAMSARVLRATELTSRLNLLPFPDHAGKAALFEEILGRPLPGRVTIYPPFYTDHGLNLELAERVFINQGSHFWTTRASASRGRDGWAERHLHHNGPSSDPEERRLWLTGAPINVAENVWIGAGATILPESASAGTL